MDENELRKTYLDLQDIPCAFEKIVLTGRCGCEKAKKFNLAEREGISCTQLSAQQNCVEFLALAHEHAKFALHLTHLSCPLPHSKELKVQGGGLLGLLRAIFPDRDGGRVENIDALISEAHSRYDGLAAIPAVEIVRAIAGYQARPSRAPS